MSLQIDVQTDHGHEGYTVVTGFLGMRQIIQMSNSEGEWSCEESLPLSKNFDYAYAQVECQRQTFEKVKKLTDRTFKRGDRVKSNSLSGFHVGVCGTVEFVEPDGKKVWVLRDGSGTPVFYINFEIDHI